MAKRGIDGAVLNVPEDIVHSGKPIALRLRLSKVLMLQLLKNR